MTSFPATDIYGDQHEVRVSRMDAHLARFRWHINEDGYVYRNTSQRIPGFTKSRRIKVYLHRHILGLQRGDGLEGNHLSRDKLDNRRCNLMTVSHAKNMLHWMEAEGILRA